MQYIAYVCSCHSTPATSSVIFQFVIFQSCKFQSCKYNYPIYAIHWKHYRDWRLTEIFAIQHILLVVFPVIIKVCVMIMLTLSDDALLL